MVFSTPTDHKTKTSIKFNIFPEMEHILQNVKFSVFTLQRTTVGENYGRKMES